MSDQRPPRPPTVTTPAGATIIDLTQGHRYAAGPPPGRPLNANRIRRLWQQAAAKAHELADAIGTTP